METLSVLSFSILSMVYNLICNQSSDLQCAILSSSVQAHSAVHRKLINMTFEQGARLSVGHDLFVEGGFKLSQPGVNSVMPCPELIKT